MVTVLNFNLTLQSAVFERSPCDIKCKMWLRFERFEGFATCLNANVVSSNENGVSFKTSKEGRKRIRSLELYERRY